MILALPPRALEQHPCPVVALGMEWTDSTEGLTETAHALRQSFEVLREVPTQATARVHKVQTGKGKAKQQHVLQGKSCYTLSQTS